MIWEFIFCCCLCYALGILTGRYFLVWWRKLTSKKMILEVRITDMTLIDKIKRGEIVGVSVGGRAHLKGQKR